MVHTKLFGRGAGLYYYYFCISLSLLKRTRWIKSLSPHACLQSLTMEMFTPFSRHQPLSSPGDCRYNQNVHAGQQQQAYNVDGPTTRTTYVRFLCTTIRFEVLCDSFELNDRSPIVTGTSVLAIRFEGGVMMAADTLGMSLNVSCCCFMTFLFISFWSILAALCFGLLFFFLTFCLF
jgi:hypothetical protein